MSGAEKFAAIADRIASEWREAEREHQTPKLDAAAYLVRTAARHKAESAEQVAGAIRAAEKPGFIEN